MTIQKKYEIVHSQSPGTQLKVVVVVVVVLMCSVSNPLIPCHLQLRLERNEILDHSACCTENIHHLIEA